MGEFLQGKWWNGKGKEYNCEDKLIFDGEYFNGKIWTGNFFDYDKNGYIKIKKYNRGHLTFEGDFKDGQINGKGKVYNMESQLIF